MSETIRYEFVDIKEFRKILAPHRETVFSGGTTVDVDALCSEPEMEKLRNLKQIYSYGIELCVVAYDGDKIIGWSMGDQDGADSFYMRNSAVYPDYRRKGVYRTLVQMIVKQATEMGFQHIGSRHKASNNAVIIPKLQAGFMISSMEISDKHGTMVRLSYYPNEKRADLFRYRTGELKDWKTA